MKKYNVYRDNRLYMKDRTAEEIALEFNYKISYVYNIINIWGGEVKNIKIVESGGELSREDFKYLWEDTIKEVKKNIRPVKKTTKDIITSSGRSYR